MAYEISNRFRAKGAPVIMGGPHTFFFAEEAAQHCDAVGIGEGENIWPKMLADASNGRLKKFYREEKSLELNNLPFPRHDLLNFKRYSPWKTGISYSFNFVFGYDTERQNAYDLTLAFLRENKAPVAYFNILTPHVGTPLYDRMRSEGRLIEPGDIGRWPGLFCYFRPKHCTPEELEKKVKRMYREFYGLKSIVGRLGLPTSLADFASWTINLSQRRMFHSDSENFDNY
jgi:radical SAM superfamily enzyme YgiQ (UPF0313 family)